MTRRNPRGPVNANRPGLRYPPAVAVRRGVDRGTRRWLVPVAALLLAVGLTAVLGSASATGATTPTVRVVGSGDIEWITLPVRSKPSTSAPVIARIPQFRPDYRPNVVLALAAEHESGK